MIIGCDPDRPQRTPDPHPACRRSSASHERQLVGEQAERSEATSRPVDDLLSLANRPKRRGLAVQRLRAAAALAIDRLRICARHGWLPGHTRHYREPLKRLREHARRPLAALPEERRAARLHLPYGPAATAAGIPAAGTPPSRR